LKLKDPASIEAPQASFHQNNTKKPAIKNHQNPINSKEIG